MEPGNADALADAIQMFADNPELVKRYGKAAAKRVREEFQIEKMQREVLKVYQELAEG